MKFINGNLLEAKEKVIAHGCNCQNGFGSGVAGAIAKKYPEVKDAYHAWIKLLEPGEHNLGKAFKVRTDDDKYSIYNCFTQNYYGSDGKKYANYLAVIESLSKIAKEEGTGSQIAIPKIGAGLGGLNWEILEPLLVEIEEKYNIKFTVYRL